MVRDLSVDEQTGQVVADAALRAADERDSGFLKDKVLDDDDNADDDETKSDVARIVARGIRAPDDARRVSAALALWVARNYPEGDAEQITLAGQLVWLATHTPCDALAGIDAALDDDAAPFWQSVARIASHPDAAGLSRAEATVAAGALAASEHPAARDARTQRVDSKDPIVLAIVREGADPVKRLAGEVSPAPRSPIITAILALTGILFLVHAVRVVGRLAFRYRKPATLKLTERGLELTHRTELLGRVLRDRETIVPLDNLARVTREVRFARIGLYAGLVALVLGSYLGMGLFVDGLRVPGGSGSLLGMGVLVIVLGIVIDFGLTALSDSVRGQCRIVVEQRKGRPLCVGTLDPTETDGMLTTIADAARQRRT